MENILTISLFAAMGVTAIILTIGLVLMGRGGPTHIRWSNRLMQWRILTQGVALFLFALLLYYKGMH